MTDHGTASRYAMGCRCTACHTAKSDADKRRRLEAHRLGAAYPHRIPHGTTVGYAHWGCRCAECVRVQSEVRRTWPSRQPRTA